VVEADADANGYLNLTPGQDPSYTSDQDGSWSPGGSQIVFASHRDSNVSTEIYVMNADGSSQRRLTHDGPEGVQSVGGQVFDSSPVWSPGGATIAYLKSVSQADDIWLMNPDGSNQRRVTFDGGRKTDLQWSSQGRLLYAAGDRRRPRLRRRRQRLDRLRQRRGHPRRRPGPRRDRDQGRQRRGLRPGSRRDVIDCGSERDIAVVDRLDVVSHCETVVRPRRR
jgi:dipeptidyl aminopeptidase/acylaminoacyl peptidase